MAEAINCDSLLAYRQDIGLDAFWVEKINLCHFERNAGFLGSLRSLGMTFWEGCDELGASGEVAGLGGDFYFFAFFDEEGDADLEAGFQGGDLGDTAGLRGTA